ncbi:MAG TPA: nucleoside hydrolase-like domain-containing protein, partial [Nitrospira sp.]|nr:nucleoside hydrolase-like domain-containing protein [Nitrospira sp.]
IPLGYNAQNRVSREDARYFSPAWIQENISSKGVMGSLYRVWGDGKQMVEGDVFDYFGLAGKSTAELRREGYVVWTPPNAKGAFLGEGDTWTFLNLVDNGLGGYRDDSYGGWGGYGQADPVDYGQMLADLETSLHARPKREETHPFLSAAQRDLAARFHWATTSDYAKANHHPAIDRPGPRLIDAKPGDEITLHARISDPDGDRVALRWWRWDAADTYEGRVRLVPLADGGVAVAIPKDTKPYDTIHVIAEATDDGAPALTRYDRIVIRISS